MKFNFKKSLCVCASALMMFSIAAPAVSANSKAHNNSPRTQRIMHHVSSHKANMLKANNLKKMHASNINKFNRIKHHILNHQHNLQRINRRLNHAQRHPRAHNARYVAMINRWNNDKARLIHAIETNEHGVVKLAKQVNNERHAINVVKHPNVAKPVSQSNNTDNTDQNGLYSDFSGGFYSDDNGKVNQGSAKAIDDNGKIKSSASLNGKPVAFNQNDINNVNARLKKLDNDMDTASQQIMNIDNQLDNDIENDINSAFGNLK